MRWHGQLNEFAALLSRMCEFRCSFSNFVTVIRPIHMRLGDENEASYLTLTRGRRVASGAQNLWRAALLASIFAERAPALQRQSRRELRRGHNRYHRATAVVTWQTTDHISVSLHGKRVTQYRARRALIAMRGNARGGVSNTARTEHMPREVARLSMSPCS